MSHTDTRYKRKRKKSFLKNARKYGKKGCYGRGSQLDPETYQYFIRIMETFNEGFATDEERSLFVNNVFEQTVDQEINCCCNQVGCRVIELLLPFAQKSVLERFMTVISKELRPLCNDRFASHVLESVLSQAGNYSLKSDSKEFQLKCREFLVKVSMFLLNNLEDYMWDTCGSHVIRTCLASLAHIPKIPSKFIQNDTDSEILEEYAVVIKDFGERIMCWPQFGEFSKSELTSTVLQVLLRALKKTDRILLRKVLKKLLKCLTSEDKELNEDTLSSIFTSKPATLLLETILEVAKKKMFTKIYFQYFATHLVTLATTKNTNFTVQKLITHCKIKSEFEDIFDKLINNCEDIVKTGHTGIIWALAQGCKTFVTRQGIFIQNLMKILKCFEPEERQNYFILCLSKFTDYDSVTKDLKINFEKEKLNLHGTLIIQSILEFNKPIKIVNCILNMEQNTLRSLFSNSMGCHIVDSYVKSTFVGEKSREKLVKKMMGVYQQLASTKYGSRSFETIWNCTSLKNKLLIIEELTYKDGIWSNSEYGKIIASKVNLVLYKKNKEQWKNNLNTVNKTKNLVDILN